MSPLFSEIACSGVDSSMTTGNSDVSWSSMRKSSSLSYFLYLLKLLLLLLNSSKTTCGVFSTDFESLLKTLYALDCLEYPRKIVILFFFQTYLDPFYHYYE